MLYGFAGIWELEQAIELLVMCYTQPQPHSLQQELQDKLSCLTFCKDVFSHDDARLEMKYGHIQDILTFSVFSEIKRFRDILVSAVDRAHVGLFPEDLRMKSAMRSSYLLLLQVLAKHPRFVLLRCTSIGASSADM